MNYAVGTLQELVEVLSQITEQSTINISNHIQLDTPLEINNENVIYIDLNENTIYAEVGNAIRVYNGEVWFTNGIIDGHCANLISIEGPASVVLYDALHVSNSGSIADVTKKGQLFVNGAEIYCDNDSYAISVEGYTRATANSKFTMMSGYFISKGTSIEVTKRGIVDIQGGTIDSQSGTVISKGDDTDTKVEISGGLFDGTVPEGSIELSYYDILDTSDGYWTIAAKVSTESDTDSSAEEMNPQEEVQPESITESVVEPIEIGSDDEVQADSNVNDNEEISEPSENEEKNPTVTEETVEPIEEHTPEPVVEPIIETHEPEVIVEEKVEQPIVEEQTSTSTILKKATNVYLIPNHTKLLTSIIGAVTILGGEFTDPKTKEVYTKVSFKLPGNGKKAIGYIVASNLRGAK